MIGRATSQAAAPQLDQDATGEVVRPTMPRTAGLPVVKWLQWFAPSAPSALVPVRARRTLLSQLLPVLGDDVASSVREIAFWSVPSMRASQSLDRKSVV